MKQADLMAGAVSVAMTALRGASPAQDGDPSPCTDYTVGQVVNHLAFGLLLAEYAALRKDWDPSWATDDRAPYLVDVPREKWTSAISKQAERTIRVWSDPTVWEGSTTFGGGPMLAEAAGQMMIAEFVVHGWDLAVATGQRPRVSEPLAAAVLEGVRAIAATGRDGGWFGPEVTVDADADALDKALAQSGRDPLWSRP